MLNIQPSPGAFHLSEEDFNYHEMQTRLVKLDQTKCSPTAYKSYRHEKADDRCSELFSICNCRGCSVEYESADPLSRHCTISEPSHPYAHHTQ